MSLHTPTINALFKELEDARNTSAMLEDYRNANIAITDENEQLKEKLTYLQAHAEEIAVKNTELKSTISRMRTQIFEAEALTNTVESELKPQIQKLEEDLAITRQSQTNLQNMNTSLNKVIIDLQSEIRILKRDEKESENAQ